MVNTISELKRGVNEVQIAIDSLGTKLDKEGSKFGFLDLGSGGKVENFINNALMQIDDSLKIYSPRLQSLLKDATELRVAKQFSGEELISISKSILDTLERSIQALKKLSKYSNDIQREKIEKMDSQIRGLQAKTQLAFFGAGR